MFIPEKRFTIITFLCHIHLDVRKFLIDYTVKFEMDMVLLFGFLDIAPLLDMC